MKIFLAFISLFSNLFAFAANRAPSIKLPKDHLVIGSEENKAIPILMIGVTSMDHTGEVKFSQAGYLEIKKICEELLDERLIPGNDNL